MRRHVSLVIAALIAAGALLSQDVGGAAQEGAGQSREAGRRQEITCPRTPSKAW